MHVFERIIRSVDQAQQRFRPAAFAFGVVKKFGDDRGGSLCALLAFYGFLSPFPAAPAPRHDPRLRRRWGSLVGATRRASPRSPSSRSWGRSSAATFTGSTTATSSGLVAGLVGVLWGSQGALQTAQYAQAEIWNIPGVVRPNFWVRLGRTASMTVVLGLFLLASTLLAGLVTIGHHGAWAALGAALLSLGLNVGLFLVAFRILTPRQIPWGDMVRARWPAQSGWTVLQYIGGLLVEHSLRNTSKEYGAFALVLGLIGFLYLAAEVTVYAAEMNVVRARHLWPRALVQPPLTTADKVVLSSIALEAKRRPEQYVATGFGAQEGDTVEAAADVARGEG